VPGVASCLDLAASHRVQSLASLLLPDGDHLPVHVSLQQSLGHLIRVVLLKVKVEGTLTDGLLWGNTINQSRAVKGDEKDTRGSRRDACEQTTNKLGLMPSAHASAVVYAAIVSRAGQIEACSCRHTDD
jgi:hypothetical protein